MESTKTRPGAKVPYCGDRPIVFFDGECMMCNAFVNQLLQIDTTGKVLIAALQGETAQRYLPPLPENREEWSFFYLDQAGFSDQSDAFVRLCDRIGGVWAILSAIRIIPAPIRNTVYRFIARNRYRWFGQRSTCRIPTQEEQQRFLP
ncbi:thiol-disulfide oxidoreductase DCC family protein [Acaryochloris thomasi]|nr:DCC1-like thiol-disulfide oxidoreductase family protein [Acaryochloris thomasi]